MYPGEVAGLILIDPTSEDLESEVKARDPQMWKSLERQNQDTAEKIGRAPEGIKNEYEARDADLQEARDSWPLPDVPVVLFSSTHPKDPDITPMGRAIWQEQHEKFLKRIPGSKHIITEKSGHAIHWQEPDLIVDAIREVVNTRTGHSR
jgi:pimeloyl-ACP methyl ester carboxylesterase